MSKVLFLVNHEIVIYNFRLEIVERLLEDGHEVIIVAPNGEKIEKLVSIGCKHVPFEFNRHGTNPVKELEILKTYLSILKSENPDIVFTFTIKPNIYGGIACQIRKIPYVSNITGLGTSIQNGGIKQSISLFLYRIGLRRARIVFFQNKSNLSLFQDKKIISTKFKLLPGSGVNLSRQKVEPFPDENNGIRFLYIGRIMKDKGIIELLSAANTIRQQYPDVYFDIIGYIDDPSIEDDFQKSQTQGTISFLGYQPDVHAYLKTHHALIQPSYHEGLSNVLLEAASTGRPVIATRIPGCQEAFDEGVSGIGCEVKNADSLTQAMIQFIELPYETKVEMGKAGRQKMEKEFNRQIVIDAYIEEIQKL